MQNELKYLVSVIIINYNSGDMLLDCIKSIIQHTLEIEYEIIIIDNNSKDDSIKKVEEKCFENLSFIHNKENRGFGAANNQGIEVSKGKYILLLNNDTLFIENSIKKVSDYMESLSEELFIGCRLLNEDGSIQNSTYNFPSLKYIFMANFFLYAIFPKSKHFNKYHKINSGIEEPTNVDVVTGAFIFAKSESLRKINGFDEEFYFYVEETDLCYRFKQSGGKVIYFPETSVYHKRGASSKAVPWFKHKNLSRSTLLFYKKHFNKPKYYLTVFIHLFGVLLRIPLFFIGGLLTFNVQLIKRSFLYAKLLFIYPTQDKLYNFKVLTYKHK